MKRAPPRQVFDLVAASVEEVAAQLSIEEKRPVTVNEVRYIEQRALRKLRRALLARGLTFDDLTFSGDAGRSSSLGFF